MVADSKATTRLGLLHLPTSSYLMSEDTKGGLKIKLFKSQQKAQKGLSLMGRSTCRLRLYPGDEYLDFLEYRNKLTAFYRQFEAIKLWTLVHFSNGDRILHLYVNFKTDTIGDLIVLLDNCGKLNGNDYNYLLKHLKGY